MHHSFDMVCVNGTPTPCAFCGEICVGMYCPIEGYSRSRGIDLDANVPGKGRVLLNTHHLHDLSEVSIPVLLAHRSEASAPTDPYEYPAL